ncbi:hypothetical protein NH288_03230 [Anaerococcus sp. NML200537]|uniref:hypothetical protein n=1 Tax=Anaerococcus sp. NML200537 TaxID=2954485 RepID=UPI002237FF8D|nr:hypothetical protein [Anaerococcus sp. NML200537]MCW6701090.1 hypothetical protein [Anaerococcus sp. NML200537]
MNKIRKIIMIVLMFALLPLVNVNAETEVKKDTEFTTSYKAEKAYRSKIVRAMTRMAPDKVRYKKLEGNYLYEGWLYYERFIGIEESSGLGLFVYGGYVNAYPKNDVMNLTVDR